MKILLTTLNAKYVHTSLAVRSLKKSCRDFDITAREYTINDNIDSVIADIYLFGADAVAFCCYIWNISQTLYICECLKKANPNIVTILGGLEVSYDSEDIMMQNPFVDFVIRGEGEVPLNLLFKELENGKQFKNVPSLTYRCGEKIRINPQAAPQDINSHEFVYDDKTDVLKNKIIYYESSRGCPYNCSYCLSGVGSGVSFLDTERVKREIKFFNDKKIPLVKFVDRTFNADKKRADELFKYIIENRSETKFHFELAGDLITDDTIEILRNAPDGLMQFEIGVQSTNPETIKAIGRKIDFDKLKGIISELLKIGTIHIHLDLIAGLPYEDLANFKKSFNDVISLKPHMLQLGFLKLLKGSHIRRESQKYNYIFKSAPPYEIISNDFMSFTDICYLKKIENVLDSYYNSGDYKYTMEYIFKNFESVFDAFDVLVKYYEKNGLFKIGLSHDARCDAMLGAFDFFDDEFKDSVGFDRMLNRKCKIRSISSHNEKFKEKCFEFLRNTDNLNKYLCEFKEIPAKKIIKFILIERFFGRIWMYNLKNGKLCDITEDFIVER